MGTESAQIIVSETEVEPTLDQMLAAYDPTQHGGESMARGAVGGEVFANGDVSFRSRPGTQ